MTAPVSLPLTVPAHEAHIDEWERRVDQAEWIQGADRDGVRVYRTADTPTPCEAFLTVTEHDIPADRILSYLGRGICGAMQDMNHLYTRGDTLRVIHDGGDDDYLAVVRTNFRMPWPMRDREFLHSLYAKRRSADKAFVIYQSVEEAGLPPVVDGYRRCPTHLSGQRITTLPNGRTRVEHFMDYELGGGVSSGIQNRLFRAGHFKAYQKEWKAFKDRMTAIR